MKNTRDALKIIVDSSWESPIIKNGFIIEKRLEVFEKNNFFLMSLNIFPVPETITLCGPINANFHNVFLADEVSVNDT